MSKFKVYEVIFYQGSENRIVEVLNGRKYKINSPNKHQDYIIVAEKDLTSAEDNFPNIVEVRNARGAAIDRECQLCLTLWNNIRPIYEEIVRKRIAGNDFSDIIVPELRPDSIADTEDGNKLINFQFINPLDVIRGRLPEYLSLVSQRVLFNQLNHMVQICLRFNL